MSLHPGYCECKVCDHGYKVCDDEPCPDCLKITQRKIHQQEHEESVAKQKATLRIIHWRKK